MNSWLDFEHRFRTLAPVLQYHRLDDQTGAAGEWWRVAGQPCKSVEEFELLCELAGEQLIELLKLESEYGNIISGDRPQWAWYRMLKKHTSSYEIGTSGYEIDENGSKNWIHTGTLYHIGESSANLALWLNIKYPIPLKVKDVWYKRLYRDYGKEVLIGLIVAILGSFFAL
ncbi:hypothetical protein V4T45_004233 [Vibrio vulnificus]|nr:hypothetical protein [Vibrio vulnificus]ELR8772848.1 hypothetical protein [Vibrio vulnificus]